MNSDDAYIRSLMPDCGCAAGPSPWSCCWPPAATRKPLCPACNPGVDVAKAALRGGSPQTALSLAGNVLATRPRPMRRLWSCRATPLPIWVASMRRGQLQQGAADQSGSVGAEVGLGGFTWGTTRAAASVLFLRALDHDPRDTEALNDLGVARDLMGDHAGAQAGVSQGLGYRPGGLRGPGESGHCRWRCPVPRLTAVRVLRPAREQSRRIPQTSTRPGGGPDDGRRPRGGERILSKDLSPEDVQRALTDYAAARAGGGAAGCPPDSRAAKRRSG